RRVGEQVHLTLFDAVLHLTARAVDRFIEVPTIAIGSRQRGDDEPRIGLAFRPLRLGYDPPLAAPALAGRPGELLEPTCRLAGCAALIARLDQFRPNRPGKAHVPRQAEDEGKAIGLTPRHQPFARKA